MVRYLRMWLRSENTSRLSMAYDTLGGGSILDLFGQSQVQRHTDERCKRETRSHDKLDGIKKTLQARVSVGVDVAEDTREVVGHQSRTIAQRQCRCKDEPVATSERYTLGDDGDARDGDSAERYRLLVSNGVRI